MYEFVPDILYKIYIVPDRKICYNEIVKVGDFMATTKAQQKAVAKYMKNNYDEIKVRVNKGTKQSLQDIAKEKGESINGYIKNAVQARFKADTGREIKL